MSRRVLRRRWLPFPFQFPSPRPWVPSDRRKRRRQPRAKEWWIWKNWNAKRGESKESRSTPGRGGVWPPWNKRRRISTAGGDVPRDRTRHPQTRIRMHMRIPPKDWAPRGEDAWRILLPVPCPNNGGRCSRRREVSYCPKTPPPTTGDGRHQHSDLDDDPAIPPASGRCRWSKTPRVVPTARRPRDALREGRRKTGKWIRILASRSRGSCPARRRLRGGGPSW
mmetsp:Transcript_4561/g.9543  ORF Transcript_4561/g.9543 Transcript_4561/m.9543 type:complete len:223 (-) Transcript_4561:427-1095(-)